MIDPTDPSADWNCHTLPHFATHCHTLPHIATHMSHSSTLVSWKLNQLLRKLLLLPLHLLLLQPRNEPEWNNQINLRLSIVLENLRRCRSQEVATESTTTTTTKIIPDRSVRQKETERDRDGRQANVKAARPMDRDGALLSGPIRGAPMVPTDAMHGKGSHPYNLQQ